MWHQNGTRNLLVRPRGEITPLKKAPVHAGANLFLRCPLLFRHSLAKFADHLLAVLHPPGDQGPAVLVDDRRPQPHRKGGSAHVVKQGLKLLLHVVKRVGGPVLWVARSADPADPGQDLFQAGADGRLGPPQQDAAGFQCVASVHASPMM